MVYSNEKPLSRRGWSLLLITGALLPLNGLWVYFAVAGSPALRLASLFEIAVGLMAVGVAWEGFRTGSRRAWITLWVLVAVLALVSVHIFIDGEGYVAGWYAFLTILALVGQLLAERETS